MPEEDTATTSEASTPDEGQVEEAANTSDEVTEGQEVQDSPEETTAPEEEAKEAKIEDKAEGDLGKFKSVEDLQKSYGELESKLGDYDTVKEKAEKYDASQLETPPTPEPEPEEIPDYSQMTNADLNKHISETAGKMAESKIKEVLQDKLDPLSQDYYGNKAKQEIAEVKQQYPDFEQYEDKIKEVIKESPGLVRSAGDLIKAYKVAKFDDAEKDGEQKAYDKLKEKKQTSTAPTTSDATTPSNEKSTTVRDAWAKAEAEQSK